VKLEWTQLASTDRERFFDYIEAEHPYAAAVLDERLQQQIQRLLQFPNSGRRGRVAGTRELVVQRTPYVVAYQIVHDTVRILRVLHEAQRWPLNMEIDRFNLDADR
jgi:toxin ParE1/3/4